VTPGHDALEFLVAGARAVAVGTASFPDPEAPWQVLMGLRRLLGKRGVGEGGALRRAPSVAERERREVGR
jgi:dihydroorotate dehydrogenase (NAD+) catalytic subunit